MLTVGATLAAWVITFAPLTHDWKRWVPPIAATVAFSMLVWAEADRRSSVRDVRDEHQRRLEASGAEWHAWSTQETDGLHVHLGALRDHELTGGEVKCVVTDPEGVTTSKVDWGQRMEPATTTWFAYPREFEGSTELAVGHYRISWLVKGATHYRFSEVARDAYRVRRTEP